MPLPPVQKHLPDVVLLSDEWSVLQFLKKWTPDDIREAIRSDAKLAQLFVDHRGIANGMGWIARRRGRSDLSPFINLGNILTWFHERRDDLFQAIITEPGGIAWLDRNFNELRQVLGI